AIGDEAAGWLVRFVHPGFAYLKIGMFVTLETSLAALIGLVTWSLWRQRGAMKQAWLRKQQRADSGPVVEVSDNA
ncbi:MAG: hypothetical protein EHM62_03750, partial [Methylococcus sp.]